MWQIIERLYLGDSKTAGNLAALHAVGVSHIVNCARTIPCFYPNDFEYLHVEFGEEIFAIPAQLDRIVSFIDTGRKEDAVLMHCSEGRDRSAAAVIAYLCCRGDPVDTAIATLKRGVRQRSGAFRPPRFALMDAILRRFENDSL